MTPQELKNSILQMAIQGKLVEQRPEEGTGEELYQQIQKEKQRLIESGKIKKGKPLPEITEEEKPFEIPESWKWVRLGTIISIASGDGLTSSEMDINGKYPVYGGNGITGYHNDFNVSKETLVIGRVGFYCGSTHITEKYAWVTDNAFITTFSGHLISMKWIKYFIDYLEPRKKASSTAQPVISGKLIYPMLMPLPPLAEQKRIVNKIEDLLPYIEQYEQAWNRLENFNKRFSDDMRKSILQMAIQGKLVEQHPEEGTAEELYELIQAEKQQLIKSEKIKKENPLPEITEGEVPFDIPTNWKWVRLGDAAWFFDAGKSPNCQKQSVKGDEWGVITTTSIQLGFFDDMQNKVLPENFVVKQSMQVDVGDILITRAGPTNRTGIACLVKECRFNLILSDKTLRINMTNQFIYKDYVVMVLNSPQIRQMIIKLMSGMDKQQVNISQDKYRTLLIPIPPLEEQKRIMTKLEEILPLCERLI